MQWEDSGTIIGTKRHGESGVIVTLMVRNKGRWMGLVRGGRSPRMASTLQLANQVQATWRARLETHLGAYTMELEKPRAAELLHHRQRLELAQIICAHLNLLPERDPHPQLHDAANVIFDLTEVLEMGTQLALFEMHCLEDLGFGLDLSECAATGEMDSLIYVSPKSGRAVSEEAGAPYKDKLLKLPAFVTQAFSALNRQNNAKASADDILDALSLTGFFLNRHIWAPRQIKIPDARVSFITQLRQTMHIEGD